MRVKDITSIEQIDEELRKIRDYKSRGLYRNVYMPNGMPRAMYAKYKRKLALEKQRDYLINMQTAILTRYEKPGYRHSDTYFYQSEIPYLIERIRKYTDHFDDNAAKQLPDATEVFFGKNVITIDFKNMTDSIFYLTKQK